MDSGGAVNGAAPASSTAVPRGPGSSASIVGANEGSSSVLSVTPGVLLVVIGWARMFAWPPGAATDNQ